jgi:hypothetical protein
LTYSLTQSSGKQKSIPWHGIQNQLVPSEDFDVLLLMDCCYASRAIKADQDTTVEVLAAVSSEITATMKRAKGSIFTTSLIKKLQACASHPNGIGIGELSVMMHRDPLLNNQSPQYIPLIGGRHPIMLKPLVSDPATSHEPSVAHDDAPNNPATDSDHDSMNSGLETYESDYSCTMELQSGESASFSCDGIIDTSSDSSFITEAAANMLGLPYQGSQRRE